MRDNRWFVWRIIDNIVPWNDPGRLTLFIFCDFRCVHPQRSEEKRQTAFSTRVPTMAEVGGAIKRTNRPMYCTMCM